MGKHYTIVSLHDGDEGLIHDLLINTLNELEDPNEDYAGTLRRIAAEFGWYENDVPNPDGGLMDIFHITAYTTREDPRPPEG